MLLLTYQPFLFVVMQLCRLEWHREVLDDRQVDISKRGYLYYLSFLNQKDMLYTLKALAGPMSRKPLKEDGAVWHRQVGTIGTLFLIVVAAINTTTE